MEKWGQLGEELDRMLKLRTPSLGVKLLKRIEDAPKDIKPLDYTCAVCQVTGVARYFNKPVLVTKKEGWACQMGGAALGFYDLEDDVKSGERNAGRWAVDAKAAARLGEGDTIKSGTFAAAIISPLAKLPMEPDVVMAYAIPDQMLSLVYGTIWLGGDRVKMITNGHGATCRECIAAPYLHNELRLAITDIGERRSAGAAEDEMVAGWPYGKFAKLMEGLRAALGGMYARPITPMGFGPYPESALDRAGLRKRV